MTKDETALKAPNPETTPSPIAIALLLERLFAVQRQLDAAKALYAEADALTAELLAQGFTSGELPDGTHAILYDNFWDPKANAPKNISWKSCGVRRFEVSFTDALSAKRSRK